MKAVCTLETVEKREPSKVFLGFGQTMEMTPGVLGVVPDVVNEGPLK